MSKKKILSIFVVVLACLLCSALVLVISRLYEKGISENCYEKFEIEEQMLFDEPEIIEQYGEPIEIAVGTRGTIADSIAASRDLNGYEYIDASLLLDNGKHIKVALTFDQESKKEVFPASEILPHSTEKYIIVFDINKVKSSQSVLEKYIQSRERYYSRVKNSRTAAVIISLAISIAICGTCCVVSVRKSKEDK